MILKIIVVLLSCGGVAWLSILLVSWFEDAPFSNDDSIKISHKDFMKYYAINPARYDLRSGYVYVDIPCKPRRMITFGFFDYWRYKSFYKSTKKQDKMRANAEMLSDYLNVVMQDVRKAQKRAEHETQRAIEMIDRIHI